MIHSTNNNEKLHRIKCLWHLADAFMKDNVKIRRPTSLKGELKLKDLKREAKFEIEKEASSEKKSCKLCQNEKCKIKLRNFP